MALLHVLLKFHCLVLLLRLQLASAEIPSTSSVIVAKLGCQDRCGGVSIPYPFGIGDGCFLNEYFEITCNNSVPTMTNSMIISNISDGQVIVVNYVTDTCSQNLYTSISTGKFTVSTTKNKLISIGCDTWAYIPGYPPNGLQGCSDCRNENITYGSCNGMGCCSTSIPPGRTDTDVAVERHTPKDLMIFNPCSYAFVAEESSFRFNSSYLKDFNNNGTGTVPVVLDWSIGYETCAVAEGNSTIYVCGPNTECKSDNNTPGYRCNCKPGYAGNPYLNTGSGGHCQDINECGTKVYDKRCGSEMNICINTDGGYRCPCKHGFDSQNKENDISDCIPQHNSNSNKIIIGVCLGLVLLVVSFVISFCLYPRKRKHMQVEEEIMDGTSTPNGWLILNRLLEELEDGAESSQTRRGGKKHRPIATIYTEKELSEAINNYHESQIIDQQGIFGTVYKGILSNGTVVRIKKLEVDSTRIERVFDLIMEIIIMSQINHENVVQLLGCCLESTYPILVYEDVTNGSLREHLNKGRENLTTPDTLSWEARLRIASEVAEALSYLHTEAFIPTIHNNINSGSILLNDDYKAKVSDFGSSMLIPTVAGHLVSRIAGTFGCLAPEYLYSGMITEKCDVYSFGVLLVELLTGEMAYCFTKVEEEKMLSDYFLSAMKTSRLFTILDINLVRSSYKRISSVDWHQQIQQTAKLAQTCLSKNGENRPTMKEVSMVLKGIMMMSSSYPGILDDEDMNINKEHLLLFESDESLSYTDSMTQVGDSSKRKLTLQIQSCPVAHE